MSDFIRDEVSIFLEAAWNGMMIAVLYDVLRILRRVVKHSDVVVGIQDYIFWVAAGIMIFSMVFQSNDGVLRGYIFLALLLGACSYHKGFSPWLVQWLSKILSFFLTYLLKKPLKWAKIMIITILRVVSGPFVWIVKLAKTKIEGVRVKHGKHNDEKKEKRKVSNIGD